MTTESEVQAQLIELLLRARALVIRVNSGRSGTVAFNRWGTQELGWQTAGMLDLIAIMPDSEVWWIECKRPKGGKYSNGQLSLRHEIEYRGAIYLTVEQAMALLTEGMA